MIKRDEQIYDLKMEKESLRGQITNLEDKLNEYTLLISNLKQQNVNFQCTFKSKEDQIFQLEKQLEDTQKKLKISNDEVFRLNEDIKIGSKELISLQTTKDDLEQKVKFYQSI
jgi:chromosome segregation ATPase